MYISDSMTSLSDIHIFCRTSYKMQAAKFLRREYLTFESLLIVSILVKDIYFDKS